MNCANHPDLPVSAYCQNCGKPLCTQCVRSVAGVVYCEPCLAARLHPSAYSAGTTAGAASASPGSAASASAAWNRVPEGAPYVSQGSAFGAAGAAPSPVLAGFLGVIPGVGAMYNGQFVKAFAHVVIFVILISISDHFNAAGILVAAWAFYQVFDAVQTAIARRDGRPLPDPFGLNDLGQRLGVPASGAAAYAAVPPVPPPAASSFTEVPPVAGTGPGVASGAAPPMPDPSHPDFANWVQRAATEKALRDAGIPTGSGPYQASQPYQPIAPAPPIAYVGRPEPVGAIVLIGVGMLFLLSTLGVFHENWIGHGWPLLIIALGAWLLFRRTRSTPPAGGGL